MEINKEQSNITLIIGENGSGKSLFAESLAVESAEKRIYLATMIPQTQENEQRIEKHRLQRRDKSFVTLEKDWNIDQIEVSPDSVVLLEDVSNLLANGIFIHHSTVSEAFSQITALALRCKRLIAVNIYGLCEDGYDSETASYINGINHLNDCISSIADTVYMMQNGIPVRKK